MRVLGLLLLLCAVHALANDASLKAVEAEHAEFNKLWDGELREYMETHWDEPVDGSHLTLGEVVSQGMQNDHIDLSWFRKFREGNFLEVSVTAGCAKTHGRECGGEKQGKCVADKCVCIGGWSGVACQLDPKLKGFDPESGSAEPNPACTDLLTQYQACSSGE